MGDDRPGLTAAHRSVSDRPPKESTPSGSASPSSFTASPPPVSPEEPAEAQPLSIPFPPMPHRHSSPDPLEGQPHSFAALGPAETALGLSAVPPPPAPRTQVAALPEIRADMSEASVESVGSVESAFPSTPDASPPPPTQPTIFPAPTMMIQLAPPADDAPFQEGDDASRAEESSPSLLGEETPKKLSLVSVDTVTSPSPPQLVRAKSDIRRHKSSSSALPRLGDNEPASSSSSSSAARRRSMGPPPRPVRSHTSHPSYPHSAGISMGGSMSADSRAKLIAQVGLPRSGSQTWFLPPNHPPTLHRAMTDISSASPRRAAPFPSVTISKISPPDMGGAGSDGLEAKVVLLGSMGVGKTSLILRSTTDKFAPNAAASTIGSSFYTRKITHEGTRVKLQIWDTAGQEQYRSIAPMFYRGAHVCIVVYDITDRRTFDDVRSWLEELGRMVSKETVIFVVGSKLDLDGQRAVSLQTAAKMLKFWQENPGLASPPPPPPPPPASAPPLAPTMLSASSAGRSLFRSLSNVSRRGSFSHVQAQPRQYTPPVRSNSHGALPSLDTSPHISPVPTPLRSATPFALRPQASRSFELSDSAAMPPPQSTRPRRTRFNSVQIVLPTSPTSPQNVSFPVIRSPTLATVSTEHATSVMSPVFSPRDRDESAGGRPAPSGYLRSKRPLSISGVISNRLMLPDDGARRYNLEDLATLARHGVPRLGRQRLHSTPRSESSALPADGTLKKGRRKSEDWSSKSWRLGDGPSAADIRADFDESVQRRLNSEVLGSAVAPYRSGGSGSAPLNQSTSSANSVRTMQHSMGGRSRGGSLGMDSRLYGPAGEQSSEDEDDVQPWGIDVEGIRLGECSALTGEGVEALFHAISSILVQKKDKIEREKTLRRKASIKLTDPGTDAAKPSASGYAVCCA